jgi:hypothetical protein
VSQPSAPRDGLEIYGRQNFASALGTDRGPGSSVGIATDYGLDGPGIVSR